MNQVVLEGMASGTYVFHVQSANRTWNKTVVVQ
jgi:hypothetical protein